MELMEKAVNGVTSSLEKVTGSEKGIAGYVLAWFLGVPATILLIVFLIRGH